MLVIFYQWRDCLFNICLFSRKTFRQIKMGLTKTEFKAYRLEINEKNCEICINGLYLKSNKRFLCRRGLQFPQCKSHKNGFGDENG